MAKKSTIIKILAMLLLLGVALITIISCSSKKPEDGDSGPGDSTVNVGEDVPLGTPGLIYNSQTQLKVLVTDTSFPEDLSSLLLWTLKDNLDDRVVVRYRDDEEITEHEIVIGPSSREVSKKAYQQLDKLMQGKGKEIGGYVLYSDGSSLALAYTDEVGDQHLIEIMEYLTLSAEKKSMVHESGVVFYNTYDMYELYSAEDKIRQDEAFKLLAEKTSDEIVEAVRELYKSLYKYDSSASSSIISWLANLYEPRNCICDNYVNGVQVCLHPVDKNGNDLCKNGGFYYSNSARNTAGFLPDVESTYQALEFLEKTGMLSGFGGDFGKFIGGQMKSDILAFTKGLQNEDGYFYHPQWTIEASRKQWSRVSRDLMWSQAILGAFNDKPYYPTPDGLMPGTGGRPASVSALTSELSAGAVSAVSHVVATASTNLPDHLKSIEAFKNYLAGYKMDVYGSGYTITNALAAQINQLKEANQRLGNNELKDVMFEYLEEKHRADNGLWRAERDYDGLNTVFKAIMVYSSFKMAFPYADKAAESAIYVLSSSEVPGHVCGTYNTWYDIAGLIGNIKSYHSAELADKIRQDVIKIAPQAIRNTINNTLIFKKSDGSFSYFADHCSETSQGMPVALRMNEGDVNASLICSGGLIEHIGAALGTTLPPIFGTRELAEFMDILSENGYSIKDSLAPDVIITFDEESAGNTSDQIKASTGSGGTCLVEVDPLNKNNQVLHMVSNAKSSTWDAVTIPNNTVKVDNNCLVFDGKFMFAKEGTSEGYLVQFYIGNMGKPSPYFINFTVKGDYVEAWEGSGDAEGSSFDRLIGKFKLDEWFKLRIEYYFGYEDEAKGITPHDTVRIKVYTNDKLVAVSANYMDASMKKFLDGSGTPVNEATQALFFIMSYFECNVYFDDLYLGYKTIEYKNEKNTEGLIVNEDADAERKTYDFEEGAPEEITVTGLNVEISDGAINFAKVAGESTLKIPTLQRTALPNVFSLGFDIKIDSASVGEVFTIKFKDPYKGFSIVSYTMKCIQTEEGLALAPVYKETTMLNSAAIPVDGSVHHLEFAFFVDKATTLIYKDGEMIASTEQGVVAKNYLYEMGRAEIVYKGKIVGSIDNVYCERRIGDFEKETKPKIDRNVYDFSESNVSQIKNIDTNGTITDKMLNLAGGKHVSIPANMRAAYVSAYQLHAYIDTTKYNGDEEMYICFTDANGKTIVGIIMTVEDDVMYIYEMLNDQKVGEYVATGKFDGRVDLDINLFDKENAVEVYVDNVLVLVTSIFNGIECGDVAGVNITSQKALIDDLYLDGITLTYTAPKVYQATQDDKDEVITYEYSSLGNYPDRVNVGAGVSEGGTIQYIERDGKLTKVLAYKKSLANSGNGVSFNFGDQKSYSDVVFETDIMLAGGFIAGDWKSNFDLLFSNTSGGTHMFYVQFRVSGGHLWVNLYNGVKQLEKYDCGAISKNEWINIRAEVNAGDRTLDEKTGARLVIYVNNVEVYNGNDFYGSSKENAKTETGSVYQVRIIPLKDVTGTIYFDNTKLKHN